MEKDLLKTVEFTRSFEQIAGHQSRTRLLASIDKLAYGLGDLKPVGDGVSELRVDFGPGYRVYFKNHGRQIVVLFLCGDKSTQEKDIKKAKAMAKQIKHEGINSLLK